MESQHYFAVYYDREWVWSVVAHTKWEAIDRAYYKFSVDCPFLERSKFKTKKIY